MRSYREFAVRDTSSGRVHHHAEETLTRPDGTLRRRILSDERCQKDQSGAFAALGEAEAEAVEPEAECGFCTPRG